MNAINHSIEPLTAPHADALPQKIEIRGHRFAIRVDAFPRRLGRVLWSTGSKQILLHPKIPTGLRRRTLNAIIATIAGEIRPAEPIDSSSTTPLYPKLKPRERRDRVEAEAAIIFNTATESGWIERKPPYVTRRRLSRYLKLSHPARGCITVRISDHAPTAPIGGHTLMHIAGVRGSLGSALAWLREGGAA